MITFSRLLIPLSFLLFSSLTAASATEKPITLPIQQEHLQFNPPAGWRNAENTDLPQQVQLMVVGKGASEFPPSLSLATENYSGTVKQYLKIVKELSISKGHTWKDLGSIRTEAGNASLSQTDSPSQWGDIKMMHVILKKNGTIYILTAAALKDEFPKFYKEIFASLRSLRFSKEISEN